jgi:hypothetical protein
MSKKVKIFRWVLKLKIVLGLVFLFTSCGFTVEDSILDGPGASGANIQWATGHFTGGTTTTAPSSSTNLNQTTAYSLQWTANSMDSDFFSHSTSSNNHQIRVLQAGDYLVSLTLPLELTTADIRTTIRSQIRVNGSLSLGSTSESSYARNDNDHTDTSNHAVRLLSNLQSGDIIDVTVQMGANVGTVNTLGQAALYMEYVGNQRDIFSATSNQTINGTDLNTASLDALEWTSEESSTSFTHSNSSSPEGITLNQNGSYLVFFNLPIHSILANGTNSRRSLKAVVYLDATPVSGMEAKQSYIRNDSNHADSSVHYFGMITGVTAGQVLTIRVQETATGADNDLTFQTGDRASIYLEYIDDSSRIFSAEATELTGGTDWNPATAQDIEWDTVSAIDSSRFTHSTVSNPQNITLSQGGDFLLIYSDSMTAGGQRSANLIQVKLNGAPISGALNATHYIRNQDTHTESSGTIVYFIDNASSGDIISISSVRNTTLTSAINDDGPARLTIWDRTAE